VVRMGLAKAFALIPDGYSRSTETPLASIPALPQQTDLLVGADGLHSVIREQLLGKQPPRYSGYTCWRGVALFEDQYVSGGISSET
jgi:hypothetical protein